MKRVLLINISKNKTTLLFVVLITIAAVIFLLSQIQYPATQEAIYSFKSEDCSELLTEYARLKDILSSLLPQDTKVIYEDRYRHRYANSGDYPTADVKTYALNHVINKGESIRYKILHHNPDYLRPLYNSTWKDFFFRGWAYLPNKILEARHRLFIFPLGASSNFDFTFSLGFTDNVYTDAHRDINFLLYNFIVEDIKMLDNQVVLVGEPTRQGVQVVSVKVNSVIPQDKDYKDFLFQLATPAGQEIDYLYEVYTRTEYLKKIEKEELTQESFDNEARGLDEQQLKQRILVLKEELGRFIPLESAGESNQISIKSPTLLLNSKISSLNTVHSEGKAIPFKLNFESKQYKRPIYHPLWKLNLEKGWCYVPDKVYQNHHNLFVLPKDIDKKVDLMGNLAFFEKHKPVGENDYGFLIYNFSVDKAIVHNHQLVFSGTPERTGACMISISKDELGEGSEYIVQLSTKDCHEVDYAIFSAQ